ncbi:MAG: 8-amino-7-oxononanoate synthase [Candidatus Omnitrophica bacterium]|nr:8-amino-7-oxononanoate synthase [Candidatus Omnitrophota bacterium]
MNPFLEELSRELATFRAAGLYRELRHLGSPQSPRIEMNGRPLLNFSSNDYLGLANDPVLKEAACRAIERFGAGAGASRLVCGSMAPHAELESALADFKGTEAALAFSSGYATALGTIGALLGPSDTIVMDKRAHACIIDAAQLCGAKLRIFRHNDVNHLEDILRQIQQRAPGSPGPRHSRTLVVTESVFSMDGDFAPLTAIAELKQRYGFWLMLDEAHATGIYGPHRRGMAEACNVAGQIEVHMGTLSKAIGSSGGFIAGARPLVSLLVNRARSFIYSTAPTPASAAAALAAIRFIQSPSGDDRCQRLWQRVEQLRVEMANRRMTWARNDTIRGCEERQAIIPLIMGDEGKAMRGAETLLCQGFFVPAIRYPTVARGAARLRLTLSAAHTADDVGALLEALEGLETRNPNVQSETPHA